LAFCFFFQAEDGIRDRNVTGVQTCALPISPDPSPGSRAASAPGGNYLSNESMYRTNRLRLAAGKEELPGGHLHISALTYPDDPAELTTPEFEADRRAIVDQTVDLVDAAARATGG